MSILSIIRETLRFKSSFADSEFVIKNRQKLYPFNNVCGTWEVRNFTGHSIGFSFSPLTGALKGFPFCTLYGSPTVMYALPSTNCLWIGALLYILWEESVSPLIQDGASFSRRKSQWLIVRDRRVLTWSQIPFIENYSQVKMCVQYSVHCTAYSNMAMFVSFSQHQQIKLCETSTAVTRWRFYIENILLE